MYTPWMIKRKPDHTLYWSDGKLIVMDARQFYIASIHADADEEDSVGPEEQEEYARLFVASPLMYDALKKVESCLSRDDNDITAQAVRQALAVAEGKE